MRNPDTGIITLRVLCRGHLTLQEATALLQGPPDGFKPYHFVMSSSQLLALQKHDRPHVVNVETLRSLFWCHPIIPIEEFQPPLQPE
jgi:hypothetical protein